MINGSITITQLILPLALIVSGFLVGLVLERLVLTTLKKISDRTKWEGDEVIIASLRGMVILWFVVAGIYGATLSVPMNPTLLGILHKVFLVVVLFLGTVVLARVATGFVRIYANKAKDVLPTTSIFVNLTKFLVFLIGILIILQSLGISITPILTALGVGGVAVALALQDTLSNLIAGLHIIVSRKLRPGDYIKLDSGEEGYVTDITWRNTTIRALPNNIVVIPNSKLASAIVTNYYLPEQEMAVLVQVGVSYDSDVEKVERVTMEVAKEVMKEIPGGIPEFEPFIRYHTFADSSINFSVIMRAKEYVDQYLVKHEFIKKLHKRYRDEGIEIPFPIRTVYMKEGKA